MVLQNISTTNFNLLGSTETKNSKTFNVKNNINIGELLNRTNEPSQKQLEAREKLYNLVASNGISYRNAQNNIAEIEKKYNEECLSYYNQEQPQNLMVYIPPKQGFDATKIPNQKDKDRYYASIRAMQEIEKNYSALFAETGLKATVMNDIANRTNKPNFDFNW